MWPTTTRNRGKSGTPGRGNEIWEGLRPLSFFSFAAPPHPRPGVAPAPTPYLPPPVPPGRRAQGPPPRRPGSGLSPLRRCLAPWMGPNEKGMRAAQSADWPPATPRRASAAGGLVVAGAGGVRPGPPRAAVVCVGRLRRPPENRGRQPPAQVVGNKGPGLRGTAGRPPCGLKPSPRGGGVVFGGFRPPRGWRPALGPLRPVPGSGQYWAGPPSRPPPGWAPPSAMGAFRGGGKPRFSPSPRGRKGGRARRPAPLGSKCGPGRGGLDSAACGRRGKAGGINAPGWWIANERHP